MFKAIKHRIKFCETCQRAKDSIRHRPPLQPIVPEKVKSILSIDLYGPLPKSSGRCSIFERLY